MAKDEGYYLVWDTGNGVGTVKEVRARYNSETEARHQADHDIEAGRAILRIENGNGDTVWEKD